MARVTRILSLVLILASVLTVALPVFAYLYRAPVTIAGSSTTSYDMLPVIWSQDNTWLASNGFMSSTAMDTRVQTLGGLNKPWMVADDKVLTAVPVATDSLTNLYFTTGESTASAMNIITGYGGYFTVADDAALEIGNNGAIRYDGYIDTGTSGTIWEKGEAINLTSNGAGDVEAGLKRGTTLSNTATTYEQRMYTSSCTRVAQKLTLPADAVTSVEYLMRKSGSPTGQAYCRMRKCSDDSVIGTFGAIDVATLTTSYVWYTFDTPVVNPVAQEVYITMEYSGGDSLNYPSTAYTTNTISGTGCRYIGTEWSTLNGDFTVKITYYCAVLAVTASVSSGTHEIEVELDGTDLNLYVDNELKDSSDLSGETVTDNSDSWVFYGGGVDSSGYINYIEIDVAGTTKARYQPTSVVHGTTYSTGTVTVTNGSAAVTGTDTIWTDSMEGSVFVSTDGKHYVVTSVTDNTHLELSANYAGATLSTQTYHLYPCLPNETTADTHVGAITWGANPAGVTVTVGGMTSSGQADVGGVSDTSTSDILPVVGGTDWRPDPGVSPALQTNPLRPIVVAVSDNTTLSEYQVWVLLGIVFVIFVTVLVGANVRGHHLITGIAASGAIILLVVWDIFPLLSLIVVVFAIWGGLVSERSPSL
ncbi:MAG: hypothetical protein M0R06_14860 [Sphaerochaeta sp.]|jgi:hypothetical protein|nr:hypothetical protein [Sphaerochaeta sp.]